MLLHYCLTIPRPSESVHIHRDPVPFVIKSPALKPDGVKAFDEASAAAGGFGLVEHDYLISLLISSGKSQNSRLQLQRDKLELM